MSGIGGPVFLLVIAAAYFLPTIVAALRHVPNVGSVAVINFFFGWTGLGWVVALAMACRSADRFTQINVLQSVGPSGPRPGWFPDPGGRHQLRFYDGTRWTEKVSDNAVVGVDPPVA